MTSTPQDNSSISTYKVTLENKSFSITKKPFDMADNNWISGDYEYKFTPTLREVSNEVGTLVIGFDKANLGDKRSSSQRIIVLESTVG